MTKKIDIEEDNKIEKLITMTPLQYKVKDNFLKCRIKRIYADIVYKTR